MPSTTGLFTCATLVSFGWLSFSNVRHHSYPTAEASGAADPSGTIIDHMSPDDTGFQIYGIHPLVMAVICLQTLALGMAAAHILGLFSSQPKEGRTNEREKVGVPLSTKVLNPGWVLLEVVYWKVVLVALLLIFNGLSCWIWPSVSWAIAVASSVLILIAGNATILRMLWRRLLTSSSEQVEARQPMALPGIEKRLMESRVEPQTSPEQVNQVEHADQADRVELVTDVVDVKSQAIPIVNAMDIDTFSHKIFTGGSEAPPKKRRETPRKAKNPGDVQANEAVSSDSKTKEAFNELAALLTDFAKPTEEKGQRVPLKKEVPSSDQDGHEEFADLADEALIKEDETNEVDLVEIHAKVYEIEAQFVSNAAADTFAEVLQKARRSVEDFTEVFVNIKMSKAFIMHTDASDLERSLSECLALVAQLEHKRATYLNDKLPTGFRAACMKVFKALEILNEEALERASHREARGAMEVFEQCQMAIERLARVLPISHAAAGATGDRL